MRIAVLQAGAVVDAAAANLEAIDHAAAEAAARGADVLLTPELFVSGYAPPRQHDVEAQEQISAARRLGEIATRHGIALVASHPEVEFLDASDRRQQFIVASLFDATGERVLHYRKVNLFGAEEKAAFTPGQAAPEVVELAGLRVALVVCYDVEYPEMVRAAARAGAEVVLVPTALTEGYDCVPEILLPARALENGVALAYANHAGAEGGLRFGGGSVVVGPDGGVLARAGAGRELLVADVNRSDVDAARAAVPYLADLAVQTYSRWG